MVSSESSNNQRLGYGCITAERRVDGSNVASELIAHYPLRFHLLSHSSHEQFDDDTESQSKNTALTCYVVGYAGLVSGDIIKLDVNVKPSASLIVTSQSTSKAFKAISGRDSTMVNTKANVGKGSLLFLVPQPTQCFKDSQLRQETNVLMDFAKNSEEAPSLILVDWYTGGRRHLDGGLWIFDSFQSSTTISYSQESIFDGNYDYSKHESDAQLIFRDSTRLTGGKELCRHMRGFNVVCMVVLLGPRVKETSNLFLEKFSSRHKYENLSTTTKTTNLNYNKGEGLNNDNEGLLVSCGAFDTVNGESGVVIRLASVSLEKAAVFLSKYIGTLDGQLTEDPFMEIISSREGIFSNDDSNQLDYSMNESSNLSLSLLDKSYPMHSQSEKADEARLRTGQTTNPLVLYQLVDSCAPTGGFAHSNTLEVAHQLNVLISQNSPPKRSLLTHAWDVILQTFTSVVPFLLDACRLFRSHQRSNMQKANLISLNTLIDSWEAIDAEVSATMTSHVSNRASILQGSGTLRAFSTSFPQIESVTKAIKKRVLKSSITNKMCRGHAVTCFGAVCGLLSIDNKTCVSMFLYTNGRDIINAAVRMNLVGPIEGGRLTNELCVLIDKLIDTHIHCIDKKRDEQSTSHQVAPLIEILSNAHDRLYTRLFNS